MLGKLGFFQGVKKGAATGPWWLSGLEHQSHDNLGILKVEGFNPGASVLLLIYNRFFAIRMRDGQERLYKTKIVDLVESQISPLEGNLCGRVV